MKGEWTVTVFIDPPSGYWYGFPRPVPDDFDDMSIPEFHDWMIHMGYPEEFIQQGMLKNCNFFQTEDGLWDEEDRSNHV